MLKQNSITIAIFFLSLSSPPLEVEQYRLPLLSFCELRLPGIHTKLPRAFCGSRNGSLFPNKKTIHSQWKASYRQPTVLKRTRGSRKETGTARNMAALGNGCDVITDSSHRISFNHAYALSSRFVVELIFRVFVPNLKNNNIEYTQKTPQGPQRGCVTMETWKLCRASVP